MCIRFEGVLRGGMKSGLLLSSLFTFYLAGLSALREFDIKKVVALSTLRQVSIIIIALRIGFSSLAFFHLVDQAFYTALLFMCVGAVIYLRGGIQDMRFLSKIHEKLPLVRRWLLVRIMCLCGLPFISGFYSKDSIIEASLRAHCGVFLSFLIMGSVLITCAYCIRISLLLFKEDEVFS